MEESCVTCKHRYKLHKSVYSRNGCEHSEMEGFVCMCFANEGIAEWMMGAVEEYGICEAYQPKESMKETQDE